MHITLKSPDEKLANSFGEGMTVCYVDVPWLAIESQHDLISDRYITFGLDNEMKGLQVKLLVERVTTGS